MIAFEKFLLEEKSYRSFYLNHKRILVEGHTSISTMGVLNHYFIKNNSLIEKMLSGGEWTFEEYKEYVITIGLGETNYGVRVLHPYPKYHGYIIEVGRYVSRLQTSLSNELFYQSLYKNIETERGLQILE